MKKFGEANEQSYLYSKKMHPIKFNLIVYCNYVYILFPGVDFCLNNVNKDYLNVRSKKRR